MKKARSLSVTKLANLSSSLLQEQAANYLASGSYKLTQEIYKILLKREDNPRYREGLAECYLQRALLAGEQGKPKDAIMFWENHIAYVQRHTANDHYVTWLLKAGQTAKIKTYLQSLDTDNLENEYPLLASNLGLFFVAGQIDLLAWLPENSAFAVQTQHIQMALVALQNNDFDTVQEHITNIPFRSVYRDFRTLLKAIILLGEAPEQTNKLLHKIPSDSPYYNMGELMMVLTLTGKELTDALLSRPHKQQQTLCKVKGWTDKQSKLLQYLSRQKRALNDKMKFDVAVQYQQLLGTDYAQRFCLALLSSYPAGRRVYEKNFGTLAEFEQSRIFALRAEEKRDYYKAIADWDQCLEILQTEPQQNALKIAFILRRIAGLDEPSRATQLRIESLDYDAEDRETHIKILDYYQKNQYKEQYKERLDASLATFPNDIEFMGFAMHAAIAKKTYKKATQYANQILTVDPVNTQAKHVLFSSHLNHARKLLKAKKVHLVEKEIKHAEQLQLGKYYPGLAQLLRGFYLYQFEDKKLGIRHIEESRQLIGEGTFVHRFRVINEAMLLDIPLVPLLRSLKPLEKTYALSSAELDALLKLFDELHKQGNSFVTKTLEKVKADFKRLIKAQGFDQEQFLSILQRLDRIKHFELMRFCLSCAPGKKSDPCWVFYNIYIAAKANPVNVNPIDISKLQYCHSEVKDMDDQRSAALIAGFLDKIRTHQMHGFSGFLEDDYDPYEELFDHLDTRTFAKINTKVEQMLKSTKEEKILSSLVKLLPNKKQMILLLKDVDLYNALLIFMAAQELNIDIQVTIDDILEIAEDEDDTSNSFPFPF